MKDFKKHVDRYCYRCIIWLFCSLWISFVVFSSSVSSSSSHNGLFNFYQFPLNSSLTLSFLILSRYQWSPPYKKMIYDIDDLWLNIWAHNLNRYSYIYYSFYWNQCSCPLQTWEFSQIFHLQIMMMHHCWLVIIILSLKAQKGLVVPSQVARQTLEISFQISLNSISSCFPQVFFSNKLSYIF